MRSSDAGEHVSLCASDSGPARLWRQGLCLSWPDKLVKILGQIHYGNEFFSGLVLRAAAVLGCTLSMARR